MPSPKTGLPARNKGVKDVDHFTGNGIIRVRRRMWWVRGEGCDGRVDRWLGIADTNVSVAGRELCCRVAMAGQVSFTKAAENLDRLGNIRVGREWLRQIVEGEGRAVAAGRERGIVGPNWGAKDCAVNEGGLTRMMVGSDGVMVPVITEAEKHKRRENLAKKRAGKKAGRRASRRRQRGADQSYKEFKIATFYDESREHQYAVGTSGNHEVLGKMMRREAGKLGLSLADEKISVSDGAKWIRRQFQIRLPMLDAMVLDFYHFAEHVGGAGRTCFGEGSQEAARWTEGVLEAARTQGPAAVLVKIRDTLKPIRSGCKRTALQSLEQYVAQRCEMLDYPTFRARGWDIGSGVTESFCKTLTARLKGSGMRWNTRNAEAMMALAALEQSNLWKPYWQQQKRAAA